MGAKIVMIDDDGKLRALLAEYLLRFGMEVVAAPDAESGLAAIARENPDLVVLDVMMPGIDGFEACRIIRKTNDVPILMLSARGEAMDKIVGLEIGADDYLAKPFEPRELVTRVQAILRRAGGRTSPPVFRFADIELRPSERDAFRDGTPVGLTSMEYELLRILVSSPNRKFGRDELINRLQGYESGSYGRSIDTLVSRLRAKIGDRGGSPKYILSSRGFGYVFVGSAE